MSMSSARLSVHLQGCFRNHELNFTKFSLHVAYGRSFDLLWSHCDTLSTSSFVVDDVFIQWPISQPDATKAALLQCWSWDNTPAVWLHLVLDNSWLQALTSPSYKRFWDGVCDARWLHCLIINISSKVLSSCSYTVTRMHAITVSRNILSAES